MGSTRVDAELLIPGRGDPIVSGSVVMEGGRIAYVGTTKGAPEADFVAAAQTVMPGIWECHAHFAGLTDPDVLPGSLRTPIAEMAARATRDMKTLLMTGITCMSW